MRSALAGFRRHDVDASTVLVEHHFAFAQGEQRVIASLANVATGLPLGADLSHEDVASDYGLTAVLLDSTHLRQRISTVATGTLSFLVSHLSVPFSEFVLKRFARQNCERRIVTKIGNISRRF